MRYSDEVRVSIPYLPSAFPYFCNSCGGLGRLTRATRGFTGRDRGTVQMDRGPRIVTQLPREFEHAASERILHR